MPISSEDRIKLFNQYSILHEIQPNAGWGVLAEIVRSGYEEEYYRIEQTVFDPLTVESCREVNDILSMHDSLQRDYFGNADQMPNDLKFDGFDGNNEARQLSYFRFMRDADGKWTHIAMSNERDLNSHFPVLDTYRRMLNAWQQLGSPTNPTQDQIDQVLAERVHPENR
ncbi:uncharacterized protein YfbU (UPF0304 family) [Labrenzia sp. EL_195]|nr:uncharacterized protein YfbU (UPF0304 family) [Labrenzia sp. EL_195]